MSVLRLLAHHVRAGSVLYDFIVHTLVGDALALDTVEFVVMALDYDLTLHAYSVEGIVVPDNDEGV